jgi:aminoglycoside 6'-N-acetyltransferase I
VKSPERHSPDIKIIDLASTDENAVHQAAAILFDCFGHLESGYPTPELALAEVKESLAEDRISRIAIDATGNVLGWVGGICQYDGYVWELHPLVVRSDCRQQGIGRSLVFDLENQVRQRGGLTLWLGTDDAESQTSLADVDLYPNLLKQIENIQNLRNHPFEFYQKMGFIIVGVMPDANGRGKPDIYMAKRVG